MERVLLNKINLLFLTALVLLTFDRTLSMEKKRKAEPKSFDQKEENHKQKEERPKKVRKINEEDKIKLQAFLDLPDHIRLKILQNLPEKAKLCIFNQIDEELSQLLQSHVTLSTLPDEIQLHIISDYLLASFHRRKANIKTAYDVDKFIKRQSLAHVSKKFRDLFLDPSIKLSLIREFVKENPQQAVNDLVNAIYYGKIQIVEDLIKAGTNVNGIGIVFYRLAEMNERKGTPLEFAASLEDFDEDFEFDNDTNSYEINDGRNVKIIRMLLEAGANPDLRSEVGDLQPTPLHSIVCNMDINEDSRDKIVLMLLKYGANPNRAGFDGQNTPLYYAIDEHYYNTIKYLLDYGANPFVNFVDTSADRWEECPLMMLIEKDVNLKEIIQSYSYKKLLFDSIKNNDATTFMALMFYKKLSKLPNFDINAQDENGYTALMKAADNGASEYVSSLLVNGADPNITTKDGKTALSIAIEKEKVNSKIISDLKKYGAQ